MDGVYTAVEEPSLMQVRQMPASSARGLAWCVNGGTTESNACVDPVVPAIQSSTTASVPEQREHQLAWRG